MNECYYCKQSVVRIEKDHFPLPQRFGGDLVVDACINCHDLKDRCNLGDYDVTMIESFMTEFNGSSREFKIVFAKLLNIILDIKGYPFSEEIKTIIKNAEKKISEKETRTLSEEVA